MLSVEISLTSLKFVFITCLKVFPLITLASMFYNQTCLLKVSVVIALCSAFIVIPNKSQSILIFMLNSYSLPTLLSEITEKLKNVGSQQNVACRSHCWLREHCNVKHLLALGATLHTDYHLQNGTDARRDLRGLPVPRWFFPGRR